MSVVVICFSCGTKNEKVDRVGRRDECSRCMADLHVCKNCDFYDESAYNECREVSAEVVLKKESGNFCDFFRPGSGSHKKYNQQDLLAQAEALFKQK